MTDEKSILAHRSLKASGKLGVAQKHYLDVFMYGDPLTHVEATRMVEVRSGKRYPARNGRIAELERMGLIRKHGTEVGVFGQKVNTWLWTGRTEPLQTEGAWIKCCHCEGKGGKWGDVPVHEKQGDFIR